MAERRVAGVRCDRPEVRLRVRTRYGDFIPVRFVFDTGADFTTLSVPFAELHGIPFSRANPGRAHGLVGTTEKFRGFIHLALGGVEYHWPCDFLLPSPSAGPAGALPDLRPVLGRAGFLDTHEIRIEAGYLTVLRPGPLRRWRRRLLGRLGLPAASERSIDVPL